MPRFGVRAEIRLIFRDESRTFCRLLQAVSFVPSHPIVPPPHINTPTIHAAMSEPAKVDPPKPEESTAAADFTKYKVRTRRRLDFSCASPVRPSACPLARLPARPSATARVRGAAQAPDGQPR